MLVCLIFLGSPKYSIIQRLRSNCQIRDLDNANGVNSGILSIDQNSLNMTALLKQFWKEFSQKKELSTFLIGAQDLYMNNKIPSSG